MKKLFLLFAFISCSVAYAQVTTNPGAPVATDNIEITLITTGTGLENYTGDIYAHTGITVGTDKWQNVIGNWGNNVTQPKLTKVNATTYTLNISPSVYDFYGVPNTTDIKELSFVFRSADGSQQTSPDIFVTIFAPELNINITAPTHNAVFDQGGSTTIEAATTINADLELFVNNSSIETTSNAKLISKSYTFNTTGNHTIKAKAVDGSNTKEQEISVYVKTTTQTQSKPSGAKNGVTVNPDDTVTFVILAPQKQDVFLIGDFNDWKLDSNYQLKKDGEYFWITLSGLDPDTEYGYQYFIDYDKIVPDPYAEKVLDPSWDSSITNYPDLKAYPTKATGIVSTFKINETEYNWANTSFTRPAKEKLVVYELLLRGFSTERSFQAVIDKLDYLESLGINALELMPVNEFEANESWGYNVSQFFALDKYYGTKNKFKELIDKCHQRGIAVIVDVVFNHSYSQGALLQMYDYHIPTASTTNNPFYNDSHNFNEGLLQFGFDFDHESTYTQNYFKDVMSYWADEYKIDGFRLDFTKGFTNTSYPSGNYGSAYNQGRIDRLTDYGTHVWNNHGSDFYMILEHLADNSEEKALADNGFMLWGKMTHEYTQNTKGNSSSANISWGYYESRGWTNPHLVTYMESHDEERLMYKNLSEGSSNGSYNVKDLNTALSRQELAGLFFFPLPGPKMIWQFGELGYDVTIFHGGDRVANKPVLWNYYDVAERKNIYDTWATLIALKKQHAVFSTAADVTLDVSGLMKKIQLTHSSNDVVIFGNFDVTVKNIISNFPKTGTWYEYFSSTTKNVTNTSELLSLQPGEYRMYSTTPFDNPLSVEDVNTLKDVTVLYPNPSSDYIYVNQDVKSLSIFDINGKNIKNFKGGFQKNHAFDIQNLSKGIYLVKIKTDATTITKKIAKN